MAYVIVVEARPCWVPDGSGGAMIGQNQSNQPGFGAALGPGTIPGAQTLTLAVTEPVPGGDTPTGANFNTALVAAAADLNTLIGTAGAWGGNTGTPLAIMQAWATGGP